ncbi:hypothetical protein EFB08_12385 [Rufibacter latericius]|uniref:Uncharacterized protein n=1 Tax=Rufibacter latericius TaxID=2487040 RepID=A0A3M9MJD6_9BACT|nr:hypothetical protein EFB08_12385 [Rufibacter latericius]
MRRANVLKMFSEKRVGKGPLYLAAEFHQSIDWMSNSGVVRDYAQQKRNQEVSDGKQSQVYSSLLGVIF